MDQNLKRRAAVWLVTILLCVGITIASNYGLLPTQTATDLPVNEPVAPEAIPKDAPKPAPKHPVYSNRLVEYHIGVTLLPESRSLQAAQEVTWRNPGEQPVSDLYFHLYPNAFASTKTTFNRESGGKLRADEMTADSFGQMDIRSIKTTNGEDLSYRTLFVQPDDGNEHDKTLMKLSLPKPVMPGQSITLTMSFEVKLPRVFARMGYADDFYMIGQWFPKLAVYEPTGTRGRELEGWNLHQYHGNSEFYADYGIYNVKINVPAAYTVAATGFPTTNAVTNAGTKTYHFYADDVHDFAWAASPHFQYTEEPFSTPNIPGVKIKLYLDPKHQQLKSRYLTAAKKSLARYAEWYGTYPYSTLSIVVPPGNANGAGGMEYPTLITAWGASDENPSIELERVVVHEIGHQFWYGMVGSNEFEEAWLDEGFTSYAEDKVMEREYGVTANLPFEASYVTSPAPLKWNSWMYRNHAEYGDNVYTRAKLVLIAMERKVGTATMNQILRTYFQKWKYKHPSTRDFQTVVEEVTQQKWDDFFNAFIYGKQMVDYAVDSIQVKAANNGHSFESLVRIRRLGAVQDAVPIRFHFADGHVKEELWDGREPEKVYSITHEAPVDWVQVDPRHTLVLENKHVNNFLKANVDARWSIRWSLGLVKVIEIVFGWVAR
jgi:hypothetical protein